MSKQNEFEMGVEGAVAMLKLLGMKTVTRKNVSAVWYMAGVVANNDETIPGSDTSEIMEKIAPKLGGTYKDDGRDAGGKRINPRIEF
jgi:hypothetical protein